MNRPGIVGDSTLQENTTMKTRNYTPEMKERAVRMLIEAKDDYPSTWSSIKAIAPKIGYTPETLRSWHKKHIDKTIPANIQAQSQAERIKELERENRELKQDNEIIKKAAGLEAQAEIWVADFTYIKTTSGWMYTTFIIDVFARAIGALESL